MNPRVFYFFIYQSHHPIDLSHDHFVVDRRCSFFLYICTDLKRHFSLQPQSQRVELGARVEIRCGLPSGMPLPTLHWLKNGAPLQEQQPQLQQQHDQQAAALADASSLLSSTSSSTSAIVTADGNVLIQRATLNVSIRGIRPTVTHTHNENRKGKQLMAAPCDISLRIRFIFHFECVTCF